jgi:hypothetical protein
MMGKNLARFLAYFGRSLNPDDRVTIDREGNIVLSYKPNNEEAHKRLIHIDQDETQVPKSDKSQLGA